MSEEIVAGLETVNVLNNFKRHNNIKTAGFEAEVSPQINISDNIGGREKINAGVIFAASFFQCRADPPGTATDFQDSVLLPK